MRIVKSLVTAVALMGAMPALAHEFWISPVDYAVSAGADLVADIRVGENMQGSAYSYVPPNFERFDVVMGGAVFAVPGRAGDRPALNMPTPDAEGLAVVVHQTRSYRLTYTEWDKFASFTEHKDFAWAQERHLERGLSKDKIVERYSRYAKSLIAVGAGAGADTEVGLLTEIVAETNPYTDDLTDGFTVRAFYDGAPLVDTQVELFEKAPGATEATATLHRTDAAGRVTLPVEAGHEYLVDAVLMRPLDPAENDGHEWESLWASLTFRVPG